MIELSHIFKEYRIDGEIFRALDDVSLTIKKGDFTAIVGPSGSGKSTLMHIIGLLDLPTRGTIRVDGKDISTLDDDHLSTLRNEYIGFVFQQFNLLNKLTVLENIMLPAVYARRKLPFDPREQALSYIQRFGLNGKERSYPNKLSGGQQQRVAIARALIMEPKLLLADEPTGNLDSKNGNAILDLIESLNKEQGVTIAMITHDGDIATRAKKRISIRDGAVS